MNNKGKAVCQGLGMLVVADDLTGANDTSVTFAAQGYSTVLPLRVDDLSKVDSEINEVAAVSTDSRAAGIDAVDRTFTTIKLGLDRGFDRLYLKVDSTMRGSIRYQIEGALRALSDRGRQAKAVLCPAYPAMGRTIDNGILNVNGVPVTQTPSGKDPICPVTSDVMTDLVPGSVLVKQTKSGEELFKAISQAGANIVVVDAQSNDDMNRLASAVSLGGSGFIPVGSAGLASALTRYLPEPVLPTVKKPRFSGDTLIVVSSIHDTSQEQVDELIASPEGAHTIVFSPHPAQLLNPAANVHLRSQLRALVRALPGTVIIRANPAKIAGVDHVVDVAKQCALRLADLCHEAMTSGNFQQLILVGGDGAITSLESLDADGITVIDSISDGVPLGLIEGGPWDSYPVMTKSGGFGNSGLMREIFQKMERK